MIAKAPKIAVVILTLAGVMLSACTTPSEADTPTVVVESVSTPKAAATPQTMSGVVPMVVPFNVQGEPGIVSAEWNFGDGTSSTDLAPEHTFTSAGT